MPVSYTLRIELAELDGRLGNVELVYDNFAAVMAARDKLMAGMTVTPKLSEPAGRTKAQAEGSEW